MLKHTGLKGLARALFLTFCLVGSTLQAKPEEITGEGALLAPLAERLGAEGEMAFISWKPVDFQKAARAGFTTVWIGAGSFLELTPGEQEALLKRAEGAGLRRLGFIGGDPEWVNPRFPGKAEKAVREYRELAGILDAFLRQDSSGALRFVLATDIEPHVKSWWDGDLSGYSALLERVVLPPLREISARFPSRVEPLLTRFEPFWWENGHVTESGRTIRGLKDFPSTVASMTYRNSAEELVSVSRAVRQRARQTAGLRVLLGVETKPPGPGIPAFITFHGRLQEIAGELAFALQALPAEDRRNIQGVFIHSGKIEADQILDDFLRL